MKIKFISPKMSSRPMDSALKNHMAPPLAFLVLGALTPDRHTVYMEDENVEALKLNDEPDMVGLSVKADTVYRCREIASDYRRRGIPIISGGIHATVCPEDVLEFSDSILIGEAEELWNIILKDAEKGQLQRIYRQERAVNPASIPIPRWDMIKGKNYLFTSTLCLGRGCPHACRFCYGSSPNITRGHRVKPVKNIIAEIRSLGVKHVYFIDDNFLGTPSRTEEIVEALRPLGICWHAAVSADVGRHEKLIDAMAASGCRSLFIGFESITSESLESCGKKQNIVADYENTINKIHSSGIMVNASMVFGFDHDSMETFPSTLDWLVRNRIETMTAHILTPYPGTKLYEELMKEGRITNRDLKNYNTSKAVFRPKLMSAEELEEGYLWMYERFYSWPMIFKRMPRGRGSLERLRAYLIFNLFYKKYAYMVSILGKMGFMGALGKFGRHIAYHPLLKISN